MKFDLISVSGLICLRFNKCGNVRICVIDVRYFLGTVSKNLLGLSDDIAEDSPHVFKLFAGDSPPSHYRAQNRVRCPLLLDLNQNWNVSGGF